MARPPPSALVIALVVFGSSGQATDAQAGGDIVVNSLGMRMVLVPAGSFWMGSPPGEPQRQEEELHRRIKLSHSFRIAATEVTQRQWLALMPSNRSPQQGDDLPVTSVSWAEAREFCLRLSQKEATPYRLPTEAEWEYACRAGTTAAPASRAQLESVAWYADNSEETTRPGAQRRPNAWGLHDMLGNAAEWTLDAYAPYSRVEEDEDPTGAPAGSTKVVRGGSWRSLVPALRCAARTGTPESYQLSHVGFRVVQDIK